jgi:type I restriction enzyme S subunit
MTDLPTDWSMAALGSVGSAIRQTARLEASKNYRLWSVPSFASGAPDIVKGDQIGSAKLTVSVGDVLICKINPRINRIWEVSAGGVDLPNVASPEWVVFRCDPSRILPGWVKLCLTEGRFRRHVVSEVSGVTGSHTRVKAQKILEFRLPLPSLDTQSRIVGLVDGYDSTILNSLDQLRGASKRVERLSYGILAVVRGISASSSTFEEVVADSRQLPALLRGWRWTRLGEVANVVGGVTKDSGKVGNDLVEVPYLRVANVQRGRLDLSRITTIRVPEKRAAALRLEPGDVLMNEGGDRDKLGRGWVWEGQIENCIHQNHVFRARIEDAQITPRLLSWWANSVGGAWCGRHGRQSVNLASISLSKIRQMPVPVPPLDEQDGLEQEIANQADSGERLSAAIADVERRGLALRRSLLDAAFSGRL